jgi:hypothetical protein
MNHLQLSNLRRRGDVLTVDLPETTVEMDLSLDQTHMVYGKSVMNEQIMVKHDITVLQHVKKQEQQHVETVL